MLAHAPTCHQFNLLYDLPVAWYPLLQVAGSDISVSDDLGFGDSVLQKGCSEHHPLGLLITTVRSWSDKVKKKVLVAGFLKDKKGEKVEIKDKERRGKIELRMLSVISMKMA